MDDEINVRDAVTDLGGGAEAGNEPDIFEGGENDTGGNDGSSSGSNEEDNQQDSAERPNAEGDDTEGAEGEGGEEGEGEGEEEGEGEGAEEGTGEEEEGEQEEGAENEGTEKLGPDGKPIKKPTVQTEADKEVEKTLNELYRNNPKLKEYLQHNPRDRATFFKAAQINKIYPGGIDEARQAKEWASDLFKIDGLLYGNGPQDFKSKRGFLELLWNECLDKDGKSTGHYESVASLIAGDMVGGLENELNANPAFAEAISPGLKPAQVATALEVVRRAVKILTGKPLGEMPKATSSEKIDLGPEAAKMTPNERKLAEENARLKQEAGKRDETNAAQAEETFNKSIYDEFFKGVKPDMDKRTPGVLKGSKLLSGWFVNEILNRVHTQLRGDEFFDAQLRAAARSGDRGPQHVAQLANMMKQRALTLIPVIADQIKDELKPQPTGGKGGGKDQGTTRGKGPNGPRREPVTTGSPGRLTRAPGKGGSNGQRPAGRTTPLRSTGDYMRDANKLLGIE